MRLLYMVSVLITLVSLAGCTDKVEETYAYTDAGRLQEIQPLNNRSDDTWIKTDKGVFIVDFQISGFIGSKVTIRNDGFLFIEGTPRGNHVQGWGR